LFITNILFIRARSSFNSRANREAFWGALNWGMRSRGLWFPVGNIFSSRGLWFGLVRKSDSAEARHKKPARARHKKRAIKN